MSFRSGRHFLQLPGPSNVPDRVLQAMDRPVIDHRGPEFGRLGREVLEGLRTVFRCSGPVLVFPSSATGAWEAALVNTLSPGDPVLVADQGFFASRWKDVAARVGLRPEALPGDWRCPVDAGALEARLREDRERRLRAVLVVHNETSTGVRSDVAAVREALDRADHPALLMVDAVSSLACSDVRHDEWRVDVTVAGSQKGLMLPPGLGLVAVGERALAARAHPRIPHAYWDWDAMLAANAEGYFPYTPATTLLFGLRESLAMLAEEGLERTFARHRRLAEATRTAVAAWGLETYCADPGAHSDSVTCVRVPEAVDADHLRTVILERFDMSLGTGLGPLKGSVFRIGHLGDFNELMLAGALSGVEMGLAAAAVPHRPGGVSAALAHLLATC